MGKNIEDRGVMSVIIIAIIEILLGVK